MAGFCVSCGNPLAAGARFCSKCGATQPEAQAGMPAAATPVATAPGAATPAAPSSGSSAAIKIIIGILCFFMFLALVAAGSCLYIGYRIKKRASEFSQSVGANAKPYTGRRQPCAMLTTSEASAALGKTVSSVEQLGTRACEYTYGSNGQHFNIEYTWEHGALTMGIAHSAMKHVAGMETFTSVPDVGDEAYLAPGNSALMMRKGDVMVNIDLREAGISADAAEAMARKIADRL
jgi:hypothetical protein